MHPVYHEKALLKVSRDPPPRYIISRVYVMYILSLSLSLPPSPLITASSPRAHNKSAIFPNRDCGRATDDTIRRSPGHSDTPLLSDLSIARESPEERMLHLGGTVTCIRHDAVDPATLLRAGLGDVVSRLPGPQATFINEQLEISKRRMIQRYSI